MTLLFYVAANDLDYGKCGVLKPIPCPLDQILFSCNNFIFKQSARICYSRCRQTFLFFSPMFIMDLKSNNP